MSVEQIDAGERVARKPHKCFDCYRTIPAGVRYHYFVGKYDGSAYTLRHHLDCHAAAMEYISEGYAPDYDDGVPPLHDMVAESGEWQDECDRMRGFFPHVVARLELNRVEAERRREACLAALLP